LYCGLVFGLLTGFLYWQNDIWKAQGQTNKSPEGQTNKTVKDSTKKDGTLSQDIPPHKQGKETKRMKEDDKLTINAPNSVFSVGQENGITAHTVINANTVNIAPPKRRISPEQLEILLPALKKLCSIKTTIIYATGNDEQRQFAEDVINAFRVAGCTPEIPPLAPVLISRYSKGFSFIVNSAPPYPAGTVMLQQALEKTHIDSNWYGFPDIEQDTLWIHVGERL
jgi:hypothetical protein